MNLENLQTFHPFWVHILCPLLIAWVLGILSKEAFDGPLSYGEMFLTILMSLVLIAYLLVNPLFPVDLFGLYP